MKVDGVDLLPRNNAVLSSPLGLISSVNGEDGAFFATFASAHFKRFEEAVIVALATAIMDRLLHKSTFLKFEGKSYRLNEASNKRISAYKKARKQS